MATIVSPSSASPHHDDNIPTATLALPSIAAAVASRRLPPPCWSPDETVALIDAYRDKWYSLRRGNLRANHWQEVADDIATRCAAAGTPKTAVQCRHKMEKLRKRYRGEIQRAAAHGGVRRHSSTWAHFQSMHSMEKGPNPTPPTSDDDDEEEGDDDHKNSIKRINDLYNYNQKRLLRSRGPETLINGAANGVRIKIPGMATAGPPPAANVYSKFHDTRGQNPNPRFSNSSKEFRDGFVGRGELGKKASVISSNISKRKAAVDEVVAAIQSLGEGFMRIEKVKMDMVKQIEEMRMEMELKRTETIIESQQRIVEAFANVISERNSKRAKRDSPSPDC